MEFREKLSQMKMDSYSDSYSLYSDPLVKDVIISFGSIFYFNTHKELLDNNLILLA